jgi:hypothetical protein
MQCTYRRGGLCLLPERHTGRCRHRSMALRRRRRAPSMSCRCRIWCIVRSGRLPFRCLRCLRQRWHWLRVELYGDGAFLGRIFRLVPVVFAYSNSKSAPMRGRILPLFGRRRFHPSVPQGNLFDWPFSLSRSLVKRGPSVRGPRGRSRHKFGPSSRSGSMWWSRSGSTVEVAQGCTRESPPRSSRVPCFARHLRLQNR